MLVGGVIFNVTGGKLSDKADEAWEQMKKAEKTINKICVYLDDLKSAAIKYTSSITKVQDKYKEIFGYVSYTINNLHKTDWYNFSEQEKIATQDAVLLVGLLYKMCQVTLVNKSDNDKEVNTVNHSAINESMNYADKVMEDLA